MKINIKIKNELKVITKIIIPIIMLYAIICIIYNIYTNYFTNQNLSYSEKLALEVVKDYKNMLKNPESIQLDGDILVIFYENKKTGDTRHFTYFTTYATNSFNAVISSTNVYCFSDFLGELSVLNEVAENTKNKDKKQKILDANVAYARYNYILYASANNPNLETDLHYTLVDSKLIAKKLNVNYIK